MITGMSGGGGLEWPSITRVIAGVVVTLALAFGGIMMMKRVLLKTQGRWPSHGIKSIGKAVLGPGLRAHLVEVDTARVLVVEGRTGMALAVLPASPQSRPEAES